MIFSQIAPDWPEADPGRGLSTTSRWVTKKVRENARRAAFDMYACPFCTRAEMAAFLVGAKTGEFDDLYLNGGVVL